METPASPPPPAPIQEKTLSERFCPCEYDGYQRLATKVVSCEGGTIIFCCADDVYRARQDVRDNYKPRNTFAH